MILDIFAGLIIIWILIIFAAGISLAITYWFLSVPLILIWFWYQIKKTQRRNAAITPEQRAAAQAELEQRRAVQARRNALAQDAARRLRGY